jgi:hypothetical protein
VKPVDQPTWRKLTKLDSIRNATADFFVRT